MNLYELKQILNSENIEDKIKERLIITSLANDKNAIPDIISMLNAERNVNRELIGDMNLELSRAHIYIDLRPETKTENKDQFSKMFILDKISEFYIKNKQYIKHCFNRFN